MPGVKEVFAVSQGVAVLADGYWAAKKGRDALKITWDEAGTEARSSDQIVKEYVDLAGKQGAIARNDGDTDGALSGAAKVLEATYVFPYLAHAPMEPNNCVIHRTDDGGVEMNFGSQMQTIDQGVAAAVLGLKPEQVKINTLLAGGSFGRRATPAGDMAAEAAEVLKGAQHKGPIKVLWTREDDIKGGRYRPIFVHKLRGGVDAEGNIVGWDQVIVGQSFMKGSPFEAGMLKDGVDQTMVEGASTLPYQIPNLRVSAHMTDVGVPTLWWRSVGSTHTAFSTETFLDQLAEAAGVDPLVIRRKLLGKHPRHLAVLELAAEKAGWEKPLPKGRTRGLAVHESFKSFVAHVVEVSMGEDGLPKVEKVVVAADCGIAINPDVIRAQLEGGMGFGLSAALFASVDLADGRVVQSNFHDYRVLRINEMPDVEVHIVASKENPTGIGEPGTPPYRSGHRQRMVEADRAARVHAAVHTLSGQGVRRQHASHRNTSRWRADDRRRRHGRLRRPARPCHIPSSRCRRSPPLPTTSSARWRCSKRRARSSPMPAASTAIRPATVRRKAMIGTRTCRSSCAASTTSAPSACAARRVTARPTSTRRASRDIPNGTLRRSRWRGSASRSVRFASRSRIRSATAASRWTS